MKIFVIISFFTLSVFSSLAHASGGGSAGANGGNGAQSVPIYRCVYTDRNVTNSKMYLYRNTSVIVMVEKLSCRFSYGISRE
ncbi:hypothetical protein [Photobacterium leiognathi]|uniref:hypothetical protein n=1 Tax=Photobacterium leiognathi TaxID=553611 RepID=UPI0027337C69|nr:hypothetical protein [Photobacterium leiognathi]